MVAKPLGKVGLTRRTHPLKALLPMTERELPKVMSVRRTQSRNAELPIEGVADAKMTWNRRSHPLKASAGIDSGLLVIKDMRLSQLEKAPWPNV